MPRPNLHTTFHEIIAACTPPANVSGVVLVNLKT